MKSLVGKCIGVLISRKVCSPTVNICIRYFGRNVDLSIASQFTLAVDDSNELFKRNWLEEKMTESAHQVKQTFKGSRVIFTYTQHYTSSVEEVFPLLCPVREYEYLPAWDCDLIYLDKGFIEEGGIFTTEFPQDGDDKDVWVVSRHVPKKKIQFVRVNTLRVIIYNVEVRSNEPAGSKLSWEQIITGLNPEGNKYVEALREEDFVDKLHGMEKLLQHYLDSSEVMVQ